MRPARASAHMSLDDILHDIGDWHDLLRDRINARNRLVTRLRNVEEATGKKILMGGGKSQTAGVRLWTTRAAMKNAWPHLIEDATDEEALALVVAEKVSEFVERLDMMDKQVNVMARTLARMDKRSSRRVC